MPRLVRRAPLRDRIRNYYDDIDNWVTEFFSSSDWEDAQKEWATPLGLALNLLFLIARANSAAGADNSEVFGEHHGPSWLKWLCSLLAYSLGALAFANAFYAFFRTKQYRLFEASVDVVPSTPSARRVRVDSSPATSSPLRFLANILATETAESRAHPDSKRHVWELSVWDPIPISLRLVNLFGPMHVLLSCMFIPTSIIDPRPSVTVAKAILLNVLLSTLMTIYQRSHSQLMKDQAIISKEVLHEYDTKFVHPHLHPPVRDVSTQTPSKNSPKSAREVETYTPTTIINRGFQTHPNPAYAAQYDPDNLTNTPMMHPQLRLREGRKPRASGTFGATITPPTTYASTATDSVAEFSSPIPASISFPRPQPRQRQTSPGRGDGGSLGVYTHAASPLRKAASTNYLRGGEDGAAGGVRRREGSPLKRMSTPGDWRGDSGKLGRSTKWDDGGKKESSRYF